MNLISIETKLSMLKRLNVCSTLLQTFCDLKKQIRHTYKLVFSYCKHLRRDHYLLEDGDKGDVELFASDIKDIALRFRSASKRKSIKGFNRATELLARFVEQLEKSIFELQALIEAEKKEYDYAHLAKTGAKA